MQGRSRVCGPDRKAHCVSRGEGVNVVMVLRIYIRLKDREKTQQAVNLTSDGQVHPFSNTEVPFLKMATL